VYGEGGRGEGGPGEDADRRDRAASWGRRPAELPPEEPVETTMQLRLGEER
jgi:hypothetical protein